MSKWNIQAVKDLWNERVDWTSTYYSVILKDGQEREVRTYADECADGTINAYWEYTDDDSGVDFDDILLWKPIEKHDYEGMVEKFKAAVDGKTKEELSELFEDKEDKCQSCTNDKGCVACVNGELWEGQPIENAEPEEAQIPTTMDEAMKAIDRELSDEDKEWLATEPNSAIKSHHSVGRWIRNNWGLWADKSPMKELLTKQGFTHPDDMSNYIIEKYVEYLKKNSHPKNKKNKNPRTQFEIRSIFERNLFNEYQWCVNNLPLKEDRGLIYQVSEFYIITSSQAIIDKVNKHFGSDFNFKNSWESRTFYLK